MKKIVLMALLVSCGLMGAEHVTYVGVSVGNTELETSAVGGNFESKHDDTHFTATVGQYVGDYGRVSLSYTYLEPTGNIQQSDGASLAYDVVVPALNDTFFLYAGPVIGYSRLEGESSGVELDLSGMHYGVQAGVIVSIIEHLEIEGGFRYLVLTGEDNVLGLGVSADNLNIWHVGANFRF